MNNCKLESLHGLRVIATFIIFLGHSGLMPMATFPVTFFFMLSGFLLYYTKNNDSRYASYSDWLFYCFLKLKNWYPLHLLTFVIAIFIGGKYDSVLAGVLNVLMISPFFENYAICFNGVSWFLCVTIFLYFIGFLLLKLIKKIKKSILWAVILIGIIISINIFSKNVIELYIYSNPLYRILDFCLGMILARIFVTGTFVKLSGTIIELTLLVIALIQYGISLKHGFDPSYYSILFSFMLIVFSNNKGIISAFFGKPIFKRLSAYSFEFFMFHELFLRIFRKIISLLNLSTVTYVISVAFLGFVTTVFAIIVYRFIVLNLGKFIKNIRRNDYKNF